LINHTNDCIYGNNQLDGTLPLSGLLGTCSDNALFFP
jgi:hypothetical protein